MSRPWARRHHLERSLPYFPAGHGSWVWSLAVLADGRLASGGDDGQIKVWPRDGVGKPVILQHGSPVRSLAVLPDGRLFSGGGFLRPKSPQEEGPMKLWPRDGIGEPVVLWHRMTLLVVWNFRTPKSV